MNSTEQKNAEDKKIREENNRQMIADYKLQYRRVTGKQCPEIELKRAWISVGIVSFRPPEFEQEIKVLQSRPDYKDHATDVENIRLYLELNSRRVELIDTLNKINLIQSLPAEYFLKTNEFLNKSIEEITDIIERKVLFE